MKVFKYGLGATAIATAATSAYIYSNEGYRRAAYVVYEACRIQSVYECELVGAARRDVLL